MPRHALKAYTTLMARIPQELADAVKQYASQHRYTVSELIRDGLEMRLEAGEVPGRSTGSRDQGGEVRHEVRPQYVSGQTAHHKGHTKVIQDKTKVRPSHVPEVPHGQYGMTEVIHHSADFDATKFYLSDLCKRGHDYQGTGKSLLRKGNANCVQCQRELRQARDARRSAAQTQEGTR